MFCPPWIMSSYNRPPSGWPAAALRPYLAQIGARIGALARDRRGMSAVEFGLAAPVFLAMLTPVIDIGLAFSQQIRVNQAVESGAQYASRQCASASIPVAAVVFGDIPTVSSGSAMTAAGMIRG